RHGADNAHRDRVAEALGAPECEHELALTLRLGIAHRNRRERRTIDLQQREIDLPRSANDGGLDGPCPVSRSGSAVAPLARFIWQHDLDSPGIADNVSVRHDVTVSID